jgi:hypothetical protein
MSTRKPISKGEPTRKLEKYYLLQFSQDWADEFNIGAIACMNEKDYKRWLDRDIWEDEGIPDIHKSTGNSGEGFFQELFDYDLHKKMKDIVRQYVTKHTVSEEFYKTFKKTGLGSGVNLCGIFDI